MNLTLVGSNTVVVAQQFNPSVIGQLWLVRNGVVDEEDFLPGCVFTDLAVQVNSRAFDLMIVPHQCQVTPRVEPDREQDLIVDKVGTIVRTLPHTPYRAVGLNFVWHLAVEESDVPTVSRQLFFLENGRLHNNFPGRDARFGAYMSKDAFGGRLKLDVKPITVSGDTGNEKEEEKIQFSFNFHQNVARDENPVARIEEMLNRWNEAREESSLIAHTVMKEESA